ncbi:myosuppressin isoform X2 [Leptopilina boulardi]|uniref:myosuppressin isoform X2 n=1 Tax=Leptopilina boulardi TaxID=63433 RepID=UPI0021F50B04|nr:myosuppressin isoform X2 [Leptopilina boulardi]
MKCNNGVLLLASATIVIIFSGEVFGMPPAQCSPGFLDEIPPRIRKVCAALSTLYELGTAMENYIEDKARSQYLQDYQSR